MSQWLQSAKATVSAGAAVISFTDNKDFASVRAGDVVMLNGQIWQCASGTRPDSAGKSTVTLAAPWPYTGASNVNAFVFRTTHDLLQLTSDARKLTNITKALLAAQEDILKGTTPTINVPIGLDPATGNEEVIAVTPWQYVINVVNASLGNISAIGAMSQAQFEAIREQNKERYAASAWVSFGNHEAGKQVNECKPGLYTSLTTPNTLLIGKAGGVGGSKTDHGVLCIAGVIFDLPLAYQVRLAPAPDGKTTYNKSTGVITNHATVAAAFNAQAADPVNVEVVINRVDMWGFEAFPQEVTLANPEIYPQGVFSDLFTSMNGVPTSDSTRPVSYFGFLGKKAKKVDFFAQSDAQKKKLLADPKNNLFYSDDGRLIQWVLRGCEFSGAGNGDFDTLNSTRSDQGNPALRFSGFAYIDSQGSVNTVNTYTSGWSTKTLFGQFNSQNNKKEIGLFSPRIGSNVSINDECYFLVCGTVNRLNQGAYHPSFNPSGSASNDSGNPWYGYSVEAITSTLKCFTAKFFGNISSANSGRPDGRYYDAIYADGDGGVCRDMRYSAYGKTLEDSAEADQEVKKGAYRGFEKQFFSKVTQMAAPSPSFSSYDVYVSNATEWRVGDRISLYDTVTGEVIWAKEVVTAVGGTFIYCQNSPAYNRIADRVYAAIQEKDLLSSVGGSFLQTDVIGNPVNILAIPQLANGWQGSWIPVIPEALVKDYPFNRENVIGTADRIYTTNNGISWFKDVMPNLDVVFNGAKGWSVAAANIYLFQYRAFAKQTENAVNAVLTGLLPYNVFASSDHQTANGSLLGESLIGKVFKNNTGVSVNNKSLLSCAIDSTGKLTSASNFDGVTHQVLTLGTPANNSPAFKAVSYLANINQQAFIQYAYTELKHNGTNWGDDGKMTIVDNQSTKTDLNGNTVLVGTAKLKEPIGWIKNKV